MYLATENTPPGRSYQIRCSSLDPATGWFRQRLVFDLGTNPGKHLELLGDVAVVFSSALEEAVARYTADSGLALERLLWNFLPRATREHLSRFQRSERYIPGPLTAGEKTEIKRQIHLFDRRRLYYLHYRAVDQSRLYTLRDRACRPLLGQCRDEREYYFAAREQALTPEEYHNYIFAIFNLQRFFQQSFATFLPEALPEDEVADRFVTAICNLNGTASFWAGEPMTTHLHPHLSRYLVMFFDYAPARRSSQQDFVRRFMNSHRTFRWPARQSAVSQERITAIFGQSPQELRQLSKKELNRLYRQKAKELHPDQGGDPASFVELTNVYTTLLRGK